MKSSIAKAAITAASSILLFTNSASAQSGLSAAVYQGCYSSSVPLYTNSTLTYTYQSSGWCQQQCGDYAQQAVFGLYKGSECYCGNRIPANSTKVDDDQCNRPCQGYSQEQCGGSDAWSVYTTGLTSDVEVVPDSAASSSAALSTTAATTHAVSATQATTAPVRPSTITQAGQTITVTPTSAAAAAQTSSSSSSSGTNKAGIAAGVVVGVVVLAAIAGGAFFYVRHRKRRAIEEDFKRQQTINQYNSGTIKSEHSATDSRLDPAIQYRRQSDGSIADDTDFSRRVLKVTNPDRAA